MLSLIILVFLLLAVACAGVYAEDPCYDSYIVELKNKVSLLGEPDGKDFCVVDKAELEKLLEDGAVEFYEPNYRVELLGNSWNFEMIEWDFAFETGSLGCGIKVGVIDSGCSPVGDITSNLLTGHNYIDGSTDTTDNIGHGTFVSGIIASDSVGFACKSEIVPLKCFDVNHQTLVSELIDAVYDAVDVHNCDVINMSVGFTGYSTKLSRAITYATNNGAIVVAAVGNDGDAVKYYPAAYDETIGVASVDKNKKYSRFSQYNDSVFVCAPGEGLESLSISGYTDNSGTSFAAPHVSAMAAIAKSIDKTVTATEFKELLTASSTDLGTTGYDIHYGYGLVNITNFINEMIKNEEVFLFPLNKEENGTFCVVYNNTDNELNVNCIYSQYEGDKFTGCTVQPVPLASKGFYKFENPLSDKGFKYMVWDDLGKMTSLTKCRE